MVWTGSCRSLAGISKHGDTGSSASYGCDLSGPWGTSSREWHVLADVERRQAMGTDKGNGDNSANMAQRLRQLEALTGGLVRSAAEPDAIPDNETPVSL